jgi:hypothetical protein
MSPLLKDEGLNTRGVEHASVKVEKRKESVDMDR